MIVKREVICTVEIPENYLSVVVKALEKMVEDEKYTKLQTKPIEDALKYLR